MMRSVAAVGDVADVRTWSGIPYYFWSAASHASFAHAPWRLDLSKLKLPRIEWTLRRLLRGRAPGGFQYSHEFELLASEQIPTDLFASEIITFNQHFPSAERVRSAGGRLNHFLDATFAAMTSNRGLNLRLPDDVVRQAREDEAANYAGSDRIITMARWAARSVVEDCGADAKRVSTVLPGANVVFQQDLIRHDESPGRDGHFTFGFVGMDWRRKGLDFLLDVRDELSRRNLKVSVLVAGPTPRALKNRPGLQFLGFIDKRQNERRFFEFLRACDLGCLFSSNEALGISILEFLRAGVPVAGFAHQGLADTLPPDAGFRFPVGTTRQQVADVLEEYLLDASKQDEFRRNAIQWSPLITWDRCVAEVQELWHSGTLTNPVRPWLGLMAQGAVDLPRPA